MYSYVMYSLFRERVFKFILHQYACFLDKMDCWLNMEETEKQTGDRQEGLWEEKGEQTRIIHLTLPLL